jgi:hypothetical protein
MQIFNSRLVHLLTNCRSSEVIFSVAFSCSTLRKKHVFHIRVKVCYIPPIFSREVTHLNGKQQSGNVSWFDLHGDVEIKTDPEPLEGVKVTAARAKEVSGLDFLRAGNDSGPVVLAPFSDLAVAEPELAEAADEPC